MPNSHKVRKNYTRDRDALVMRDHVRAVRLVAQVRPDQYEWLAAEADKRAGKGVGGGTRRGRGSKVSEIVREGIDLIIEMREHAEFMRLKLGGDRPPVRGKYAREQVGELNTDMPEPPPPEPEPPAPMGLPTPGKPVVRPIKLLGFSPPAREPGARSPESAAPGQPSCGTGGRSG